MAAAVTWVKDASTGALIPIVGVPVTETLSNPTAGQILVPGGVIFDGAGGANVAGVDASSNLHIVDGKRGFTETNATLGSNAVYNTGFTNTHDTWATGERYICLSALATGGGSASSGWVIAMSDDATNWVTVQTLTVASSALTLLDAWIPMRYWAVKYTNGASAQTAFALNVNTMSVPPIPMAARGNANAQAGQGIMIFQGAGILSAIVRVGHATGDILYTAHDPIKATYSAGGTLAAVAGDSVTIAFGTKIIKLREVRFTATSSAAAYIVAQLIKRSTVDTAGTSTVPTAVAHDASDAATGSTLAAYTVAPTLGTAIGTMMSERRFSPAAATPALMPDATVWQWTDLGDKAPTLRATGQLALNLSAACTLDWNLTWTEE